MPPQPPAPDPIAAALDACAAPTAQVDADGRVLRANRAFVERFGGVDALQAVSPGLDAGAAELAARGPQPLAGGELHLRPLQAGQWWAQWLPAADAGSAEQRQLQMFADTVAHDLRAPLRSIDSFAKLLEDRAAPKLDAAERMHLSRIRAAATRMTGLLTALGELSRATSAAINPTRLDLSVLAEWVAAELQDAEPARQVEVIVQPGLEAIGDERLVRQLLRALLENAWTFTRGRDGARIDVRGHRDGARSVVEIEDNGCGFDMQYAHKLFQPFQRLHGAAEGAGHGLGLAIAQRIARRHGGDVQARSGPCGSTFTLVLPAPTGEGGD